MKTPTRLPLLAGLLCLFAGPALAGPQLVVANDRATPPDVAALVERDESCQRWSRLEISDQATDVAMQRALVQLRCDALTVDRTALLLKYAHSPTALQALAGAGINGT